MSDKTAPPSREATPSPKDSAKPKDATSASDTPATSSDSTTPTPSTTAASSSQTLSQRLYGGNLEEEVGQVMKGFGSFWGGFKARSAITLTTLKSDLDKTVTQVQNDLKQLQDTKVEVKTKDEETWKKEEAERKKRTRVLEEEEAARKEAEAATQAKGKGKARDLGEGEEAAPAGAQATAQATATALFNRLSMSTSQLQTQIQSTVASTLAAAKANPTLANTAQLRTQLAENLRLQTARENITLSLQQAEKLAEEYLKKGEGYLKEAERVAEKWVEENVRVIPPHDGQGQFIPSTGWDTGEWYAFSTVAPSEPSTPAATAAGPSAPRSSAALAGSRKEALLRRLREDKELLMVDPASEAETKERRDEFAAWVADKWPTAKVAGREADEGAVGTIRMALVPEHLTDEQFWQRYLFHKDMIEAADNKRKALLQATQQETADDFSWDDDEEATDAPAAAATAASTSAASPAGTATATATPTQPASAKVGGTASAKDSPAATSPRDSEESYDVVSRQPSTAAATEDDDDSDWE